MFTPITATSTANEAAANAVTAESVSSVSQSVSLDTERDTSAELTLFNIQSDDEYKEVIAELSRGSGVAPFVTGAWDWNRMYRISQGIDWKLVAALNRRAGIYSPQQYSAIRAIRGAENYPLLIDKLCRAAKAEVSDAFGSVERPEKLVVSGMIELSRNDKKAVVALAQKEFLKRSMAKGDGLSPDEIVAMIAELEDQAISEARTKATEAAHNMEDLMYGQLEDGGWESAFDKCVDDALTLKMGVIYGPYPAKNNQMRFERNNKGKLSPVNSDRFGWRWDWRSPFDMFPAAGARGWHEGDLVDRIRLTAAEMLKMKGFPGWVDHEIDACVASFWQEGFAYYTSFDSARAWAEERGNLVQRQHGFIECLRFFGNIRGDRLMATGVPNDTRKMFSNTFYEVQAIVCGVHVLFLSVLDPAIDFRPYVSASFAPDVGGLWGKGFGEIAASEDSINAAAARGEVDNAGFCVRPLTTRVPEILVGGTALGPTVPGQVFISTAKLGDTRKPVTFETVNCNLPQLQSLRTEAEKSAYELAGLPYPDMGTDRAAGAGRTSSGFAEIVSLMKKPMQDFIYRLERDVVRPNAKRLVVLNNMYHDNDRIKTEAELEPQGLFAELARLANSGRKMELYDRTKADPLISNRRRAVLLRSIAQDQRLPDSFVPSDREAVEMDQQQAETAAAAQGAGQGQVPGGEPTTTSPTQPHGAMNAD